jgi:hypothetical protein
MPASGWARASFIAISVDQRPSCTLQFEQRAIVDARLLEGALGDRVLGGQRRRHVVQLVPQGLGAGTEGRDDLVLAGVGHQLPLQLGDLLQLLAVDQLRHRHAGLLHRQPGHRHQVGDDQHNVLRHLRPGDGAHAAEKGAQQDAAERGEHADLEGQTGQAGDDQADPIDLRHHIGEGAQDRTEYADAARQPAAVAFAQEIGHRELAELAQVGREEQCHHAVAAGPAEDEGQAAVAGEVQRAGQADERGRAHPIGTGGHAVVHRRHAAAGHVVLRRIGGAAGHADAGVDRDGRQQEADADGAPRQTELLQQRHQQHEQQRAHQVRGEGLVEPALEGALPGRRGRAAGMHHRALVSEGARP